MKKSEENFHKIRAGRFRENNGLVLNTINLLRGRDYMVMSDLKYALDEIDESDLLDSVNFLQLAGYITLFEEKKEVRLADADFDVLKALVSDKGVRLLNNTLQDDTVVFKWRE